ncbi:MAG: glycoside hydrolase family 13 protein [Crocinitomicaceae bacterium]
MKKRTFAFWVLFFVQSISFGQKSDFKHVEPANWWSDMNLHTIQVLFHGDNIAGLEPNSSKMPIVKIDKTENPNYLFITFETQGLPAGIYPIEFKQGKKKVKTYSFELKTRDANSKMREGISAEDVVYLLMPDRFANGNEKNDSHPSMREKGNRSHPGGRHGGDIQGIIDHLDYIHELGATAIWSTPLLCDDDSTYSYHTYGQSDVYKIDPRYGDNADYKRLVDEAHKRDMKIVKDMVTNHWGAAHWMFTDLPTYEWIHQFPGYKQTSYRMTTIMDPNASKSDADLCEKGWFVKSMPDLNQSNPLVFNYLTQNAIWWIEYSGLDAFRVDTYSYNEKFKIAEWTKAIMDEYPNFSIVGEVWLNNQAQISYFQKNSPIGALQNYNSHLPQVMDFTLYDAVTKAFKEKEQHWNQGMIRIYENFVSDFLYSNPLEILVFLENHDTDRFNQYCPNLEDYKLAMTLLATTRGIPQIYYGTEIGMAGDKSKGDAAIRLDFPGGWTSDANNAFTASGRTEIQAEYFEITKKLLNFRKTNAVLHTGKLTQFVPENNMYVYFRHDADKKIMVVLNNSDKEQNLSLSRFEEMIQGHTGGLEMLTGQSVSLLEKNLKIAAKTPLVIILDNE